MSIGARNRGGIGLSYRPARLHKEVQSWNFKESMGARNRGGKGWALGGEGVPIPTTESVATLPPFGPIEGQKWFDRISS